MKLIFILRHLKSICANVILRSAPRDKVSRGIVLQLYKWMSLGHNNFVIMPLIWLDHVAKNESTLLRYGVTSIAYAPHFMDRPQFSAVVKLPDVHYYIFNNARVSSVSSSVIVHDEKIIIERAAVPDQKIHNYAGGHIRLHNEDKAVICLSTASRLSCGIFLGGNGAWNYYHWMLELLTKLEFISRLPSRFQGFPLLISEEILVTPSLKETLDVFTKCQLNLPKIIVLKKELSYVVDELLYINATNSLPFNLIGNAEFKCVYSSIDSQSVKYLRNIALQYALKDFISANYSSRIFLSRKNIRRNFNQDEVFYCLQKFGFIKVFMEDLSFSEQVKTINQAEFIVGPTGAAWTNLIFSNAGSKALCWMAEEADDFSAYSNIAKIVGVDLIYITYRADVRTTSDIYSKKYTIDINKIKLGLKELGLQLNQDGITC